MLATDTKTARPGTASRFLLAALSSLTLMLAACGGGGATDDGSAAAAPQDVSVTIGAAGGTVAGPAGVTLTVPAAAVAEDTVFRIVRDDAGAPPLVGMTLLSPVYQVTPHGLALDAHATLTLPYDASKLPAGSKLVILRGEADGTWHIHQNASTAVGVASADVSDFSWFAVGTCTPGDAGVFGFGIGDCPANHRLEINVFAAGATGNVVTPLEAATDITVSVDWTRPLGLDRTDGVLWHGPGLTTGSVQFNDPSGFFHRDVGSTRLDPATIAGSRGPNGKVLHYRANAQYCWTGFIIGRGANQTVCWNFDADLPVTVHDVSDPTGAPVITAQPRPTTVVAGAPASFSVAATAPDTLTYLWQVLPPGITLWFTSTTTGPRFDIADARLTQDGALYRVQVCNTAGPLHTCILSDAARLSVVAAGVAPVFLTTPSALSLQEGQTASLTASASGTPAPRIRFYQGAAPNGVLVQECPAPGTGSSSTCTYTSPPLGANPSSLAFYAVADNSTASVTSPSAVVTVASAATAPVITGQPAASRVAVGGSATFVVTAAGTAPLAYQWQLDGVSIADRAASGATSGIAGTRTSTLTITNAQLADGGNYVAVVSNGAGSTPSVAGNLAVVPGNTDVAPTFTLMPAGQSTLAGGSASFAVAAGGSPAPTYAWSIARGGISAVLPPAPGGVVSVLGCSATLAYSAGGTTITLTNVTLGCDGTSFVVVASNRAGSTAPASATLSVASNQPSTVGACFGDTSGWCYLQPAPVADSLSGLVIDSGAAKVYAVGVTNGLVMKSSDSGNSWNVSWDGQRYNWNDLAQPSSGVLVATGSVPTQQNGIFRSLDGGTTWSQVFTGTFGDIILGVTFADANVGIATGSKVWRTTNGGATWTPVAIPLTTLPSGTNLYRAAYAGNNVFVTIAGPGAFLRSADAGLTWTRVTSAGTDYLVDLAFGGSGFGVAAQQSQSQVLRTTDYGATWSVVSENIGSGATSVAFADANTVVAMGQYGGNIRSTDGGASWTEPDYGLAAGQQNWRTRFRDASFGLSVGQNGAVARTTDGGVTWTRIAGGTSGDTILQLETSPAGNVTVYSNLIGQVRRSTDAGLTWNDAQVSSTSGIDWFSFGSADVAMGFGLFGTVTLSTDAGAHWTEVLNDPSVNFNGGGMASATTAVAVGRASGSAQGSGGFMRRTTDAGATWSPVTLPTAEWLWAVRFLTPSIGLAGGNNATLLRTVDGGATWTAVGFSPNHAGDSVQFIARVSNTVAVMTTDSEIKRSTDGGLTWTRVHLSAGGSLRGVAFRDTTTGISVGTEFLRTSEGGLTWTTIDVPVSVFLGAAAWASPTTPLAGGDGGALLRNQKSGALSIGPGRPQAVRGVPTRMPARARTAAAAVRAAALRLLAPAAKRSQ